MRDYSREAKEILQTIQAMHRWLHRYFHQTGKSMEDVRLKHELTMPQFHMLITIRENEPINLKELSEKLGVSAPSASLMLDKLVEMGLVLREQSNEDRREIQIRLSNVAKDILYRREKQVLEGFSALLETLGDETVNQWLEVYRKIQEHLKMWGSK